MSTLGHSTTVQRHTMIIITVTKTIGKTWCMLRICKKYEISCKQWVHLYKNMHNNKMCSCGEKLKGTLQKGKVALWQQ